MSLVVMAHTRKCHGDPVVWCTVSQEMWCCREVWDGAVKESPHVYGRHPVGAWHDSRLVGHLLISKRGRLPPAPPPTRGDLSRARAIARGAATPEVLVSWSARRRAAINEVAGILERRARRRKR